MEGRLKNTDLEFDKRYTIILLKVRVVCKGKPLCLNKHIQKVFLFEAQARSVGKEKELSNS